MAQKRYSKKKLAFFKKHIQAKLDGLTSDLDNSRDSLGSSKDGSALSQDSVYSVHMADAGTDSNEREKAYHLYNRQTDYRNFFKRFRELKMALLGFVLLAVS